jgi:hypothetical protein
MKNYLDTYYKRIHHNTFGRNYALIPSVNVIINDDDYSIHLTIWNHHWYIVFKK